MINGIGGVRMTGRTEKEKALIIRYIIITLLVLAFFVSTILVFYSKLYEEKRTSMIKDGRMSAMQAANLLENYLTETVDTVNLTAYALDKMITEKKTDHEIQEYLIWQSTALKSAINENSTGVYGYINGKFFSGTSWEPPEGYNATNRPWYIKPFSDPGNITVLDPYVDIQSGNVMIALGKTLCDGVSVVSIDASLEMIQALTENAIKFDNADCAMILNDSGIVIAHSDKAEIGKDYHSEIGTLGSDIFVHLNKHGNNYFELESNGSRYIVYAADIQNDWHSISVMDSTTELLQLNMLLAFTIAATFLIVVIILIIMINFGRRKFTTEKLNAQLNSLSDVYMAMHEINFFTDTFSTIHTSNSDIAAMISKSNKNSQELIRNIMTLYSDPSTRADILDFVDFTKLNHRLKDCDTVTIEYLNQEKKWRRARFLVSERVASGKIARAMYLVEDIDTEKRERDQTLEAVRLMNEQISSVANIYFAMQDVDIKNNTLNEIKTKVQRVSDLIGGQKEHAQEIMYAVMDQMSHESSRASMHEFINLSTLDERLRNTNTITEEFLSCKEIWSRARFIVSQRAPDGTIEHVLWLVEGIDSEKRRRDRLVNLSQRAVAANEAKTSFLSKMSHNIRTPIHAMLGMNELVLRECKEENIRIYSENIRNSGTTLLGLVNDILDISSIEAGKTQIVRVDYDLSCTISDLVNMVQADTETRGLGLALDIDSNIPKLLNGDEAHLRQVLMNLLNNAVNSTSKGNITFGMHYEDIPDDPESIMLNISIMDSGNGTSPEYTDIPHSDSDENEEDLQSLAVNVAESMLKMLGCSLKTESVKGVGSTYSFSIKQGVISREPLGNYEESYREAMRKRRAHHKKFRAPEAEVLIADDIPVNLMLLSKLLDGAEICADTALSGEKAIKLAKDKKYDIMIFDQIMPEKTGVETLREIRCDKNSPNVITPAICFTANAINGAREQYLNEGFDGYISKPLDPEALEELLIKYLPEEKVHFISSDK